MFGNGRKVAVFGKRRVVGKHFIHSISKEVFSQEVSSLNTENKLVAGGSHGNVIGSALINVSPVLKS